MTEVIRRVTWPVRWINRWVSRFFTIDPSNSAERICKEPHCGRLLFVWQNGKYCTRHSRARRVHTVLVVLPKTKSGK